MWEINYDANYFDNPKPFDRYSSKQHHMEDRGPYAKMMFQCEQQKLTQMEINDRKHCVNGDGVLKGA